MNIFPGEMFFLNQGKCIYLLSQTNPVITSIKQFIQPLAKAIFHRFTAI